MRDPGFVQVPFATGGDVATIPNATQASGAVSMQQGWGPDYQKDLATDPDAKAVERQVMNGLMNTVTQLLQRWQTEAIPEWIDAAANGGTAYPYPRLALVRYLGGGNPVLRISLVDNNTSTPSAAGSTANWADADTPLYNSLLLGVGTLQTVAGPVAMASGSKLTGSVPAATLADATLVSAQWATGGRAANLTTNASGYFVAPSFLTANTGRRFAVCWGQSTGPLSGVNQTSWTVSFPLTFAQTPVVLATLNNVLHTDDGSDSMGRVMTYNPTTGGVSFRTQSAGATATVFAPTVSWIAIGSAPAAA